MPASHFHKIGLAKLGLAIAVASLAMRGAEASAAPAVPSDTLQIGTGRIAQIFEGGPETVQAFDTITESAQSITGTEIIELVEPGTQTASDFIMVTISASNGQNFFLTVTLTSDVDGTPLTNPSNVTPFEIVAETGAVQDFGADFTNQFDLDSPLPSILVFSDLDTAVPEPASLGLLGAGLAGLGLLRRRKP